MDYNGFQNNKILELLNRKDGWELFGVTDILVDDTKGAVKIKKEDYMESGTSPIIDQGQRYIGGYTNEINNIYKSYPIIIFGDHTRIIKYVDFPFFLGADGVKLLKSKLSSTRLNVKYLYHFLKTIELPSDGYSRHFKYLKEAIIPVPKIEIQENIVEVLDKAQELIDKRKSQIEALDELVKSRFIEMFGDPVSNPMKWKTKILSDISTSRLGKMLDSKKQTGKHLYPYLANFNVQWFRFELKRLNEMDFDEKEQKEFELRKGDLLVCEGGEVGRSAVWEEEISDCYFQKALHRVRCNQEMINPYYLAWLFYYRAKATGFKEVIGSQATIAHLTGEKLKQLQIIVPPIAHQNEFAAFVNQVDKLKFAMEKSLKELENNFNSLMQKAFNGELFN